MSYVDEERRCIGCGDTEEKAHLDRCLVCGKWFCTDCSYKRTGRRFCSSGCARDFFWGDSEEDGDDTKDIPEPDSEY